MRDLDEQLGRREHDPRYEQGRARKQQDVIEDSGQDSPLHTAPCRRRARAAADVMGIPPTLRTTPDGRDGSCL